MKKLLFIFCISSSIAFAQEELVGLKSVGVNFNGGWGGLTGFRGQAELFLGKYIQPNLQVGLNTFYGSSGPGDRYQKNFLASGLPLNLGDFPQAYDKDYSAGANIFAKYYFTSWTKFRPFLYGELGGMYHLRKYARELNDPITSGSKIFPNAALGLGSRLFLNKAKTFNLELIYTFSNPKNFSFDGINPQSSIRVDRPAGNLRVGLHYSFGK